MSLTPEQALVHLQKGNQRFVENRRELPRQNEEHIRELADTGQAPIASILGCSDSRAPIEHVFDAGFGELFVMRVAGNLLGPRVAGTLQYAVEVLKVPLLVVLGHTGCGAVTAALSGGEFHGPLGELVKEVETGGKLELDDAVIENVRATVSKIRRDVPGVAEGESNGTLRVVGAVLAIETGEMQWLD